MSDLTFNKIAGGVLATGLAIFGLREVTGMVFEKHPPEKPGYAIAVAEETTEGPAAEAAIDWGTAIPTADVEAGKAVSAKCSSCHTFDAGGANGTGPNLFGILGKRPGTHPGFAYSPAMVEHGAKVGTWGFIDLGEFLKAPQKHIVGTKMGFIGLKKPEDRIAIVAYLNSLGGSAPLPAPAPAAAPVEAAPAAAPEAAPPAAAH